MAYTSHLITTLSEVVPLWAAFASSCGWTVDNSTPAAPAITHPGQPGSLPMRMKYETSGTYGRRLVVDSPSSTIITGSARMTSPVLNPTQTSGGQSVSAPTRVHFMGSTTGTPYIATVVEFGYNSYRHVYVGFMEKSSSYGGGEVFSATWGIEDGGSITGNQIGWAAPAGGKPLFNAASSVNGGNNRGGVRVVHASVPIPWREFRATTGGGSDINGWANSTRDITVFGGYLEGPNTGYAIAGKSEYAVSAVVAPIPLLLTVTIAGVLYFKNIGRPTGVRHINVENFEPGAQVSVGSRNFIVFPWMSKRPTTTVNFGTSALPSASRVPNFETSGYLGYAYEI